MSFHKEFVEGSIWFPRSQKIGGSLHFGLVLEILTDDNSYRILRDDGVIVWGTYSIDPTNHERIL